MRRVPEFQFEWIDRSHPNRASVESFIATVFARRYGAQVHVMRKVGGLQPSAFQRFPIIPLILRTTLISQSSI
jgi:hypothetical protein